MTHLIHYIQMQLPIPSTTLEVGEISSFTTQTAPPKFESNDNPNVLSVAIYHKTAAFNALKAGVAKLLFRGYDPCVVTVIESILAVINLNWLTHNTASFYGKSKAGVTISDFPLKLESAGADTLEYSVSGSKVITISGSGTGTFRVISGTIASNVLNVTLSSIHRIFSPQYHSSKYFSPKYFA